jgi:hypothetical protein
VCSTVRKSSGSAWFTAGFFLILFGFFLVAVVVIGVVRIQVRVAQADTRNWRDRLIGDGYQFGGRIVAEHFGVDPAVRSCHSSLSFRLLGTTGPADNSG